MDTSSEPRRRLLLVVTPRLLGDTLARVLRAEGLDVVIADDGECVDAGVDIAIMTDPPSSTVDIPVIIRLPAPSDHGVGTVIRRGEAESVDLSDVGRILATVQLDRSSER